jgi:type II secretory pathway pseudopilin PulG
MGALDTLQALAVFFNDAANGTFLLVLALVALILAAVGVVWMRDRVRRLRRERADLALWNAEVVNQAGRDAIHGPDPVEEFIDNALKYDRDHQWLREGVRPTAPDVHDVPGDDDD